MKPLVRNDRVTIDFVIDLYGGITSHAKQFWTTWDLTGQTHEPFSRGDDITHPDV